MKENLLFLISFFALLTSCQKNGEQYYTIEGNVHGTYYSIMYGTSGDTLSSDSLTQLFHRFDRSLSTFDSLSVISRINRNEENVSLDSFFLTVYEKGMEVSRATEGAFDMTVAPLVNCWGFGFKKQENVTPQMVDSLLELVGYRKVSLVNGKVIKQDSRMMLDASAIAKGYSCDVVAAYLQSMGIADFKVEIGGELVVKGKNPKGEAWRIGITKPSEENSLFAPELQEIIEISDCGMATSGNYRQFYYKDGKRFSHTINPHTGYPAEQSLLSATVIAKDCMSADAYATSFMVMGIDSAFQFASQRNDLAAFFIYAEDDAKEKMVVKYTESFKKYLHE